MGLAKSLRKAGNLEGFSQGLSAFGNYLEQKRQKEEQKNLFNNVFNIMNDFNHKQKTFVEDVDASKSSDSSFTDLLNANIPGSIVQNENIDNPLGLKSGNKKKTSPFSGNTDAANLIGEQKQTSSLNLVPPPDEIALQKKKYDGSRNLADEFNQNLLPYIMNPDTTPEQSNKINYLGQLVNNRAEQLKPKRPESELTPEGGIRSFYNEYGQEINRIENIKDFKDNTEKPTPHLIKEIGKKRYFGYADPNGNQEIDGQKFTITKIDDEPKGSVTNVNIPKDTSKEPEYLEQVTQHRGTIDRIDSLLANAKIKDDKGNEGYYYDGKFMTAPELKALKTQEQKNLEGSSDKYLKDVSKRDPKLAGIDQVAANLWPKLTNVSSDKIDEVLYTELSKSSAYNNLSIEEREIGATALKNYFKSRIYGKRKK